jgi:hypothetical protein
MGVKEPARWAAALGARYDGPRWDKDMIGTRVRSRVPLSHSFVRVCDRPSKSFHRLGEIVSAEMLPAHPAE